MKLSTIVAAGLLLVGLGAPAAQAVTLATLGAVGPLSSPGSIDLTFNAAAGTGAVYFELNGFATLDGENCCTDVFTLSLNGTDLFSGSFNLGGGGNNTVYLGTYGTDYIFGGYAVTGGLSYLQIGVLLPGMVSGSNTVTFRYDGADQGLGDEGWGIGNANTFGNGVGAWVEGNAVPEPASWALLITGFAMTGATLRRRRTAIA